MRRFGSYSLLFITLLWAAASTSPAAAQYFGRNKVQYDDFDFRILETEHFEIFYYPEEEQAVRDAARMAERWYERHSRTFLREFQEKKPIIFYANDADFQQTNVISGFIGEGTGGVTEGLKQRVVMPLTGSYAETDHVLGHELVHSFQYDIAFSGQDTLRFNIGMLPLWMVEGTAEYLSVGREDSHTAMWMRDAVLRDDLPSIDQLTRGVTYFPYRYGQAYMAYIGGKYGDAAVANLYKLAGRAGVDSAFVYTLGITTDSLSTEWQQVVTETYEPFIEGRTPPDEAGRVVLSAEEDAGEMNIGPVVSPDGQYVAFLSERDIFTINLFVADAETGEVLTSLRSPAADPHMDALRFISSAGTWSPDGTRLAFISFAEGDNEISILDIESRDVVERFAVEGVAAMTNPSWSPDGESIAFTGLDGGISDLYVLNLNTSAVRQLTNDRYTDVQPAWSPDGRYIAFTTDRGAEGADAGTDPGTDFETLDYGTPRLAIYDTQTNQIETLQPFENALHHNPQFSPDGLSLYFISDQDGFKDVYRLALDSGTVHRVTNIATGVSGITDMSPAMSVAAQSGRMMYSVFYDNKYTVFSLERNETEGEPVEPLGDAVATANILPPIQSLDRGLVGNYLNDPITGLPPVDVAVAERSYTGGLRLDYVAPPTVGVSAGGVYGTQLGGGVGFFFSDMLGNKNLTIAAQAQGTFKDIGGQVSYIDLGDRLNFGGTAGHIPLLFGYARSAILPEEGVQLVEQLRQRIFIDQASGIAQYPLSTTRRLEGSAGFVRYGFNNEVEQFSVPLGGGPVGRNRIDPDESVFFEGVQDRDPIYFFQGSAAYVGDYSFFAFTSPVEGGRYRFQVSPQVGTASYVTALADYRRYRFFNPLTLAYRAMHVGSYGADPDDFYSAQYLGYAYYPGFIRGYNFNSFDSGECTARPGPEGRPVCAETERLQGTHLAMASIEMRVPLFGSEVLGLINFPYLPTEISLFTDAGVTWSRDEAPIIKFDRDSLDRIPVVSSGISARVNILGYIVLETYYAYPFQRPGEGWQLGFQLAPGW